MNFENFKYLVVGSGFFGSVIAERIANDLNEKVLVIEKRNHIGGNCFSTIDDSTGIEYHKYGTHIFHTSNKKVWDYINRFTEFNGYVHQVLTTYKNKVYQMPINLETINAFYNINLKPFQVDEFIKNEIAKDRIKKPKNFEEKAISLIGKPLYEAFIKGYTIKHWQRDPKLLPESIFNRLPFRKNYNENYYFDRWQGIPLKGYSEIFKKMLNHKNICLKLNIDYFAIREQIPEPMLIIYSGPIDRYFDFKYGNLEWSTLEFCKEVIGVEDYQGTAVMNYADESIKYTRIHEPKHLHAERNYPNDKTLIIKEFSKSDDGHSPFYPINDEKNQKLVLKYRNEAAKLDNVIISGRLGDYKYYDMHHTIAIALDIYEKRVKKTRYNL
ncbi:MAG: UDP-galactopyranose mutase [Cytophagales bacterium]|nr:UDP-galactopyranose mutase [Cytophagales bacterium]